MFKCIYIVERLDPTASWTLPLRVIPSSLITFLTPYTTPHLDQAFYDMRVKLVLFDALYTIVKPRAPIHVQYTQVFEPYLGKVDPMRVKDAFNIGKCISHVRAPRSNRNFGHNNSLH